MLEVLNFALWELIDNVDRHSRSPIQGYAVVQNFDNANEVRLIIADCGIGIMEGLKLNPSGIYSNISNEEALTLCIQKGVTNGTGAGNGLFLISEIIRLNKGRFTIYSGENSILVNNYGTRVFPNSYWKGTLVHLTLKKNTKADYKSIFDVNNLGNSLEDSLEMSLSPNGNALW